MIPARTPLLRYGGAALAMIVAVAARLALNLLVGDQFPLAAYFLALVFVAWYGGLGPTLSALAVSLVAIPIVSQGAFGSVLSWGFEERLGAGGYFLVGLTVALLGGWTRAARLRAEAEG